MAFSTSSNATGSEEMKRTERRSAIRSANSREARNCSGGGMRIKSSATCLYDFIASVSEKLSTFYRLLFTAKRVRWALLRGPRTQDPSRRRINAPNLSVYSLPAEHSHADGASFKA